MNRNDNTSPKHGDLQCGFVELGATGSWHRDYRLMSSARRLGLGVYHLIFNTEALSWALAIDFVIQWAALPPQAGKGALFKFASGFNIKVSKLPSSLASLSSRQLEVDLGTVSPRVRDC